MFKSFLFVVIMPGLFQGFSQGPVLLDGKIIVPELESYSIHIINFTQKTGTVNDDAGGFTILVKEGDILVFSSIQYAKLEIEISAEILDKRFLEISLAEEINVLA